jgi:hypothetical protein
MGFERSFGFAQDERLFKDVFYRATLATIRGALRRSDLISLNRP